MKSFKILFIAAFALFSLSTFAQDFSGPKFAKWGEPAARMQNITDYNFYKEAVTNRDYNVASSYFHKLVANCPTAMQGIYTEGIKMYKNQINSATNLEEKNIYVDSLLIVYDLREAHFGSHPKYGAAYIKDRKARELLTYRPNDRAGIRNLFTEAIEVAGTNVDPDMVLIYFSNLCDDFNNTDDILPEIVIDEYDRLAKILISTGKADEQITKLDSILGLSGAANCEILETLFKEKLAVTPDDVALLEKAIALMARANCTSDFFLSISERYYSIAPSADAAMFLAQGFQERKEFDKASKYLNDALAAEQDPVLRKDLLIRISLVALVSNDFATALSTARQARDLDSEDGVPYFIMAQCYANSSNQCGDEFARQTVYWVAYDTMARAISYLPEDSDYLQPAKNSFATYRSYFPSSEECFFNEVKAGERYVVSCSLARGISTTVRFR